VPAEILKDARLVLMTDVLEHVPDDYALLSELLAAVQPGTYFLLTVPADPALWSPHDESFGHYRRYRLTDFQSLWAGLPVDTHMVSYFNARLRPVIKSVRWWNRLRKQSAGAAGTDFSLPPRPMNRLLSAVFAGEAERLVDLAAGRRLLGYRHGVSLVALIQRRVTSVSPRSKPADAIPDLFDPVTRIRRMS
jgi:Methyltransferase domain